MKKMIISMLILFAWVVLLSAQITREQADAIVLEYVQDEVELPYFLSVNNNVSSDDGIVFTTHRGEIFKAKYACFVYFLDEYFDVNGPAPRRYLFVKKDTGSLLEVLTNHDYGPDNLSAWTVLKTPTGLTDLKENNSKLLYPNPVNDLLSISCSGNNTQVEIYDLSGTQLFFVTLLGEETHLLDVSFLNSGIYMVRVSNKMGVGNYKIIKN